MNAYKCVLSRAIWISLTINLMTSSLFAQNSGVSITNDDSPADNSAMLDVKSNNKGILIPRVTLTDLTSNTIPVNNPTVGLMVYNQDNSNGIASGFYSWAGTQWNKLLTMSDLPDNSATNELQTLTKSGNTLTLSQNGGTLDLSPYLDGKWIQNGSDITYNEGNVGIGAPNPNDKLVVAGTINSTSGGVKFPDNTLQTTAAKYVFLETQAQIIDLSMTNVDWTTISLSSYLPANAKCAILRVNLYLSLNGTASTSSISEVNFRKTNTNIINGPYNISLWNNSNFQGGSNNLCQVITPLDDAGNLDYKYFSKCVNCLNTTCQVWLVGYIK